MYGSAKFSQQNFTIPVGAAVQVSITRTRQYLGIQNNGVGTLYIGLGVTPDQQNGIQLFPNGYLELHLPAPDNDIQIFSPFAEGKAVLVEAY